MYQPVKDTVVRLRSVPSPSAGAPHPVVVADEGQLFVAYIVDTFDEDWDGRSLRIVSKDSTDELVALAVFERPYAHLFGPPNDEAFRGHPLASRGLRPYSASEVNDSSWIRALVEMNSVHPCHDPSRYSDLRHFVLAFHDSTFECVAEGIEVEVAPGSVLSVIRELPGRLGAF